MLYLVLDKAFLNLHNENTVNGGTVSAPIEGGFLFAV